LVKLKIPKGEIRKALLECSGKYTSQNSLEAIEKLLPSEEEEQMIKAYEGSD